MRQTITITAAEASTRIDAVCAERFPAISRSRWTAQGVFTHAAQLQKPKTRVQEGQVWEVACTPGQRLSGKLLPYAAPLEILADSDTWCVVHKPAGIAMHPSPSQPGQQTLVNILVHHFGTGLSQATDLIEGQVVERPGLVHRIDKPTMGLILVAKTTATHAQLQSQWGSVEKYYLAWIHGTPPPQGVIEAGIRRDPLRRQRMMVDDTHPDAKPARTSFLRLQQQGSTALLLCRLHTGRTHQIRVHLSSLGFPIVGDALYGGEASSQGLRLYATALGFDNPDAPSHRQWVYDPFCLTAAGGGQEEVTAGIDRLRDLTTMR
ncbi:RluA family pseudouridine synthase [Candidatus Peribacteria bacterium]|nr:RluA family pseudouridine synthase [Candidatus Peribacteria bacterium]